MSLYKSTNTRKLFPGALNTWSDNGEAKETMLIECKMIVRAIIAPFERTPIKNLFISRIIASYDIAVELLLEKNSTTTTCYTRWLKRRDRLDLVYVAAGSDFHARFPHVSTSPVY